MQELWFAVLAPHETARHLVLELVLAVLRFIGVSRVRHAVGLRPQFIRIQRREQQIPRDNHHGLLLVLPYTVAGEETILVHLEQFHRLVLRDAAEESFGKHMGGRPHGDNGSALR